MLCLTFESPLWLQTSESSRILVFTAISFRWMKMVHSHSQNHGCFPIQIPSLLLTLPQDEDMSSVHSGVMLTFGEKGLFDMFLSQKAPLFLVTWLWIKFPLTLMSVSLVKGSRPIVQLGCWWHSGTEFTPTPMELIIMRVLTRAT